MSLGLIVVEVCERNEIALLPLEELEDEFIEVAVMRTDCLNMCNLCRARPFALINQKRVYASTTEQCLAKVKEAVEEEIKALWT